MWKRKPMSLADATRSFLLTALFIQLSLDFVRWVFWSGGAPPVLCAQWIELIAAVIAAATTIISAAASSAEAEEAGEEAEKLWRQQQRDKQKQRRLEVKQERQVAVGRELDLRHNERVIEENEKARKREREEAHKAKMKAHGEAIAGIMEPQAELEPVREQRIQTWGV